MTEPVEEPAPVEESAPVEEPAPVKEPAQHGDVGALVARLASGSGDGRSRSDLRHDLAALVKGVGSVARDAGRAPGRATLLGGGWLVDLLLDIAPRIPVRDLTTLREQHPGLGADDLAQTLISGAAKSTGAVGAAGGALAAVEFAAPPTLLATPVQLAAETLLVAAIEVKLIAELHEVYGLAITGSVRVRMQTYLVAWTERRGIDPFAPGVLRLSLGATAKRSLRKRLFLRAGRNLSTLGPMMTGAIAGSVVNHRETRRLGEQVRDDLRRVGSRGSAS